jgi:hypothetical protein
MSTRVKHLAAVVLAALVCLGSAEAGELYRCEVRDQVSVQDDGTVGRSGFDEVVMKQASPLFVDTNSGMVRLYGISRPWRIIQREAKDNGFIASWQFEGPASTAVQVIQLSTWKTPVTFALYDAGQLMAGVCEPAR